MFLIPTFILISVQPVLGADPSVSSQVLGGRVSVARCRAKCLAAFQGDGSCHGWGCQECWSLCHHLDVSGDDQSHICHHEECQEGCQTACGFYFYSNATPKSTKCQGSTGCHLTLPAPSPWRCQSMGKGILKRWHNV